MQVIWYPYGKLLNGTAGNDSIDGDWIGGQRNSVLDNLIQGNGGIDQLRGGEGNDTVRAGGNNGTWAGGSGSSQGNNTYLAGGNGNDLLVIERSAQGGHLNKGGSFEMDGGAGADKLIAEKGSFVKMQDYSDERDVFVFGDEFTGTGEVWGFDKGIDKLEFWGGNWSYDRNQSTSSNSVFTNTEGGKVTVYGIGGDAAADRDGTDLSTIQHWGSYQQFENNQGPGYGIDVLFG
ncbi:hypothetical protein ACQKLX_12070 [Bosea sp. NPDC003192]|jgi:Ca2+-binding RTX toxin-like protein|uniref:hypothetical protein n=1 Tax=Bosea sp. NPDC003192 TaxID=3390551 RepID=UPI003D084BCE